MKNLLVLTSTFLLIPALILVCLIDLSYISNLKSQNKLLQTNKNVAYAALPTTENLIFDKIESTDSRLEALSSFFSKYKSELFPYTKLIIETADNYGLDYRLVPAIAMQESNLCKKAPKDSYNCWGFGIYGKNLKTFENYSKAIEAVTKTLAYDYKANGLVEPKEIMTKYTPSSKGTWANGVSHFMNEISTLVP